MSEIIGINYKGQHCLMDLEDYLNIFKFHSWHFVKGYLTRHRSKIEKSAYFHRFVLGDKVEGYHVDHINGRTKDNRKENLRIVNQTLNSYNRKATKASSRYRGVHLNKRTNKWKAQIQPNRKNIHLGYFNSEEDAAKAYDKKAREIFGSMGRFNFPLEGEQCAT